VGEVSRHGPVAICEGCSDSFKHQLGHGDGRCDSCGRSVPQIERLHGEGDATICEACLWDEADVPGDARLTHLTSEGEVHMVDVGGKPISDRRAVAEALVSMSPGLADALFAGELPKGDALATVRLAGIMAAKRTPDLIPLAHPIGITSVGVRIERHPEGARIEAECGTAERTGIEMEAMTAAAVAALTLYDMVKSVERGVTIERVRLLSKRGGRSGDWSASGSVVADTESG
jgi:cyclic pyranopterin monophosphate synthase